MPFGTFICLYWTTSPQGFGSGHSSPLYNLKLICSRGNLGLHTLFALCHSGGIPASLSLCLWLSEVEVRIRARSRLLSHVFHSLKTYRSLLKEGCLWGFGSNLWHQKHPELTGYHLGQAFHLQLMENIWNFWLKSEYEPYWGWSCLGEGWLVIRTSVTLRCLGWGSGNKSTNMRWPFYPGDPGAAMAICWLLDLHVAMEKGVLLLLQVLEFRPCPLTTIWVQEPVTVLV